ncbi:MAG: DCC1-like thiol-disulfide oxidoreductase family protein [Ginsengibacter sp.]
MPNQRIILFDGVCNLCNSAVKFVLKRDKKSVFKFASLQSDIAKKLLKDFEVSGIGEGTFVLIDDGEVFTRSTAALKVSKHLSGIWPLMTIFMIVPRFMRDWVYNLISKNRYRWFGKRDTCMIPSPEMKIKFLNELT